jgi:uridine phosphorylase
LQRYKTPSQTQSFYICGTLNFTQLKTFAPSELIVTERGSIYHLDIRSDELANDVILVGDPSRVKLITSRFESVECSGSHREFVWETGWYNKKRFTVLSTGIGTDNIDIVLTELDAAANIDLETLCERSNLRKLNIVRLGTSGALQGDILAGSIISSKFSMGFDPVLHFYQHAESIREAEMEKALMNHIEWNPSLNKPYVIQSSERLFNAFRGTFIEGITISAPGFYGPQGRALRIPLAMPDLNHSLSTFRFEQNRICNYEMEGSAIYALSKLLGHESLTICTIIANRINNTFDTQFNQTINRMIDISLHTLSNLK